jgi:hypothetical protein
LGWGYSSVAKHLLSMHKTLESMSSNEKKRLYFFKRWNTNQNNTDIPSRLSQNGNYQENNNKCWQKFGKKRSLYSVCGTVSSPCYATPGICSKECKSTYSQDTCIPIFVAALCTIAKTWNDPRCPSNWWVVKENVAYLYNGILFSH